MGHELSRYRDALDFLFARTTGGSKFGLERTEALLRVLGDPHRRLRCLHVAGTNGKGSVCATLEAVLRHRGLRVGRYTSPHLVDFRERFLVDGAAVDAEYVIDFIERWTPTVERIGATFFEATTAMAFAWFAEAGVDAAVIETGLGGRLDSTNVVRPLVAGVTAIGIDHVEYLGDTRESIAAEKAGIFKAGVPAVIGEPDLGIAALLATFARDRRAEPVISVWHDAPPRNVRVSDLGTTFRLVALGEDLTLRTPLLGEHQASNTTLALLMVRAAGEGFLTTLADAAPALAGVQLPGRFHRRGPFIFDVAHNPDGATVVARTVGMVGVARPLAALLTVLVDKDWRGVMRALAPVVDLFVLSCAPTAPASRAWRVEEALAYAAEQGWPAVMEPDFDAALARSTELAATVLVTGSFHTVGDAMARLQVDPLTG
ncbi:MAG TPA: folylpolyglutamate synthase/dihydrofolate synthase family protein [Gemmatimonadaceae bacterium]|nr:folylpolyglutamate synthase/dihydrofolate synthase family protein [Gemmatimonadaceae bacterium]